MKRVLLGLCLILVGCSSTPTAPTPPATVTPPVVVTPPPVVTPPQSVTPPLPATNPLLSDPLFNLSFYRQMALDAYERSGFTPLTRQTQPPLIYLRTVHDNGSAIDAATLNATAAALINTTGKLTGVFGLAGLEQGVGTKRGQRGWITVSWADDPQRAYCGRAAIAGDWIELYTNTGNCRCAGGPLVRLRTVKHELGHALGFYHTDSPDDLMFSSSRSCDMEPSQREIFHAKVAYSQPIGSLDPK